MSFFNTNNENKIVNGLLNVQNNNELFKAITILQNQISVGFNTKVIAVCGVSDDKLAAAFAKALADSFGRNGSSCLIIDANLYNPCLASMIGIQQYEKLIELNDAHSKNSFNLNYIDKKIHAICMNREVYPSTVYKSGAIQRMIKDEEKVYEHFIVIMPSIKDHKEIFLIKDVVDAIVMLAQKNVTIKKHIYDAIQFLNDNQLPLAKTVILK